MMRQTKACEPEAYAIVPAPQNDRHPFLDQPAEIRNTIYELIAKPEPRDGGLGLLPYWADSGGERYKIIVPAIARTCHQMRTEFLSQELRDCPIFIVSRDPISRWNSLDHTFKTFVNQLLVGTNIWYGYSGGLLGERPRASESRVLEATLYALYTADNHRRDWPRAQFSLVACLEPSSPCLHFLTVESIDSIRRLLIDSFSHRSVVSSADFVRTVDRLKSLRLRGRSDPKYHYWPGRNDSIECRFIILDSPRRMRVVQRRVCYDSTNDVYESLLKLEEEGFEELL